MSPTSAYFCLLETSVSKLYSHGYFRLARVTTAFHTQTKYSQPCKPEIKLTPWDGPCTHALKRYREHGYAQHFTSLHLTYNVLGLTSAFWTKLDFGDSVFVDTTE